MMAPGAAANGFVLSPLPAFEVDPVPRPLPPFQPVATNLTVTVPCDHDFGNETVVRFSVSASPAFPPAWLAVTLRDETIALASLECGEDGNLTVATRATLLATMDAPGVVPFLVGFQADLQGEAARTLRAQAAVSVAYVSLLSVDVERPVIQAKPGDLVEFPVTITNHGNEVTRITFRLGDNESAALVPTPLPVTLQSRQAGGLATSTTVMVRARAPEHFGVVDEMHAITLHLLPSYALNASMTGEPQKVSFVLRTKGVHVPAPGLGLVLPLLAAAALAARSARRDP